MQIQFTNAEKAFIGLLLEDFIREAKKTNNRDARRYFQRVQSKFHVDMVYTDLKPADLLDITGTVYQIKLLVDKEMEKDEVTDIQKENYEVITNLLNKLRVLCE